MHGKWWLNSELFRNLTSCIPTKGGFKNWLVGTKESYKTSTKERYRRLFGANILINLLYTSVWTKLPSFICAYISSFIQIITSRFRNVLISTHLVKVLLLNVFSIFTIRLANFNSYWRIVYFLIACYNAIHVNPWLHLIISPDPVQKDLVWKSQQKESLDQPIKLITTP